MLTLGIQEEAIKTCSRQVKPPRNSTRKAVGRRVHTMPAQQYHLILRVQKSCFTDEGALKDRINMSCVFPDVQGPTAC